VERESMGVRASSEAARWAVSGDLAHRAGDREQVGLQLERRVAVTPIRAHDDIAEDLERLVQRARVMQRLTEPERHRGDLIRVLGERKRLSQVTRRVRRVDLAFGLADVE
jgi:hypothetical protein